MTGMFFELFVFLSLVAVAFLFAAIFSRRVWPVLLASVFFVLTGASLLSDGLRYECGAVFTSATGVMTVTDCALLASESSAVSMIGNTFVYGGVLVAVAGMVFLFRGRRGGRGL